MKGERKGRKKGSEGRVGLTLQDCSDKVLARLRESSRTKIICRKNPSFKRKG